MNAVAQRINPSFKVLFVQTTEEESAFLTRNLPVTVSHFARVEQAKQQLKSQKFDALLVDVSTSGAKALCRNRKQRETPLFVVASSSEIPQAVDSVRQGADGFLIKGVSHPSSLLKLIQFASSKSSVGRSPLAEV